jgi:hypothetical protein
MFSNTCNTIFTSSANTSIDYIYISLWRHNVLCFYLQSMIHQGLNTNIPPGLTCLIIVHQHGILRINEKQKYHTARTVLISKRKGTGIEAQIHCSLRWLATGSSIQHDRIKLVLWTQTSLHSVMMRSYKCFLHVSKMPTLTYDWVWFGFVYDV